MAKQRRAVALKFERGVDDAPVVVAKGKGRVADQIVALAQANNIPLREDKNLVQVLSMIDLDEQIPTEAYQAVATILAFIYKLNQKQGS